MGSGISKLYQFPTHEFHSNIKQYSHYYNSLHLSEDDIWKLYQVFQEIDQSQLGYIKILDLIKYLKLLQTKFIYKIFTIFDTFQPPTTINNQQHNPSSPSIYSGCIHFHQFVISCWSVCTLYQKDYTLYLFNLYDLDESGFLDIKITQQIIEDIYGDEFKRDMEAQRYHFQIFFFSFS